jgi:hypothetical protein
MDSAKCDTSRRPSTVEASATPSGEDKHHQLSSKAATPSVPTLASASRGEAGAAVLQLANSGCFKDR